MKRIRGFFYRWFLLGKNFHSIFVEQKVIQSQIDFMLRSTNRSIRRKWRRMLLNKRSPFYIGEVNK